MSDKNTKPAARKPSQTKTSEARFESLIRNAADMIVALDAHGMIQYASPSVERILGYKPKGTLGKNFLEWVHPDDLPAAREAFASRRAQPGPAPAPLQVRGRHRDGSWRMLEALGTNLLDDPSVNALILNVRDVTERVQSERRLAIQHTVTLALSTANTLAEAMPKILPAVCEGLDWKRGECWSAHWSMDKETMRLRCVETCQVSTGDFADFEAATGKLEFAPGEGLPGRVWKSGKPEWTPDITKDGFVRVQPAKKAGFRAAFAFPVKLGDEVLGVMTFLDGEVRPPDEGQLRVMETIGQQIGQFVVRKRAEAALKISEERYRDLVENTRDLICTHDLDGRLLSVNRASAETIGYQPGELVGHNLRDFLAPDVRARLDGYLETIRKNGAASGVMKIRTKSGEDRLWEFRNTLRTEGLDIPIVRGFAHDITERIQAARALEESEKRFRALVEHSSDEISIIDAQGNLLYESPSADPLLGYQPGEFLGRSLMDLIHPDDRERVQHQLARMFAEPALQPRDQFRLQHRDGKWVWVEAVGTNLLADPAVRGVVINYHDIAARKQAEDELAQRLREIVALRDIGLSLDSDVSLDKVILAALDGVRQATQADLAVFFRMGKNRLEFQGVSPSDSPHHASVPVVPLGACLCGLAVSEKKPIYSLDIHADLRCTFLECKTAGVRSFASLPLIGEGEVIGSLGIASHTERDFEKQALFLEAIAMTVSISLRNALLYEEEKSRAAELEREIVERKQAQEKIGEQLAELQQWHNVTLGREMRVIELKHEVNQLLQRLGEPIRYPSGES